MERTIRMVCFDLDKTLTTTNSWLVLNTALGMTPEEDNYSMQEYAAGRFTYQQGQDFLLRIYQERGLATRDNIMNALQQHTYAPNVREVITYLRQKGYLLALISGSVDLHVQHIANDLGIEYWAAHNHFEFDAAGYISKIVCDGDDVDAKTKYLQEVSERSGIPPHEIACVGDGANDKGMFLLTGNGVTFPNSKIADIAWKIIDNLSELETIL